LVPISVYPDIDPDIGIPDIGYVPISGYPISGNTRYRVSAISYPISGSISGYTDIGKSCPDIGFGKVPDDVCIVIVGKDDNLLVNGIGKTEGIFPFG
jgi:hypothetical protein